MPLGRVQKNPVSFQDDSSKGSEPDLIMRKHQIRGIKQSPSPGSSKNIKVLRAKERPRKCSELKDTRETRPLHVTCGPRLGPFATKDVIGTTGGT